MRNSTRALLTGALAVAMLGGTLVANALWGDSRGSTTADLALGGVNFSAQVVGDPATQQTSAAGEAVSVRLPGSVVIGVLDQVTVDAEPVIWRFRASGNALGITGLNYTVAAAEQTSAAGAHSLAGGVAAPGTVLEKSTMKIYPAGAGSDCSAIPATPEGSERNVYLFGADDAELQAAGAGGAGLVSERDWCVALTWNSEADGTYINDVQVTGTADDGSVNGAMARWHGAVGFPPALEFLGSYRNRATVEATAEDTTLARATADWFADLYPDPSGEPDVVITLDPIVTNLNPEVPPRD